MKHNYIIVKQLTGLALAMLAVFSQTTVFSATPAGSQVYPTLNKMQTIELVGGSSGSVIWTAPAVGTYKLWVQIPGTSTASSATYMIYPKGNAVGNNDCSSTDPTYPCYQVKINQSAAINGWVQLMMNGLTNTTWDFVKLGYVTTNASSVSHSEQLGVGLLTYQKSTLTPLVLGQSYQGGKIFYLDASKQHGLIASATEQSTWISWRISYLTPDVTGATGTAIGTGQANTTAIVTAQGEGFYAAKQCDDLVLNGYSDWYLPSKDELNQLYINRAKVGSFGAPYYWSSSEGTDSDYAGNIGLDAWGQAFGYSFQFIQSKYSLLAARCVRSF